VEKEITFVGMDAHKKSINVAMLLPEADKPLQWQVANEPSAIKRLIRKLEREAPGPVRCCYEAGPGGYALKREFAQSGIVCQVVAPSLIPRKPGERIKTDRRDAHKLAELFRAGLLTEVQAPTEEAESVRDLVRCREDAVEDRMRCRNRLVKMLLRRGLTYTQGQPWTHAHRRWLYGLKLEQQADQVVLGDYLLAIEQVEERIKSLEAEIETIAKSEPYEQAVGRLRCFRGIETVTAMTLVAELHDFRRFESPRELMSFVGLVPSESSSGESCRRGSITKTGNGHARRVLIESAHHYRHPPTAKGRLAKRRQGQPAQAIAVADKAQQRLFRRYWQLVGRHKSANVAVVAVARELVGFIWASLTQMELPPTRLQVLRSSSASRAGSLRSSPQAAPLDSACGPHPKGNYAGQSGPAQPGRNVRIRRAVN